LLGRRAALKGEKREKGGPKGDTMNKSSELVKVTAIPA